LPRRKRRPVLKCPAVRCNNVVRISLPRPPTHKAGRWRNARGKLREGWLDCREGPRCRPRDQVADAGLHVFFFGTSFQLIVSLDESIKPKNARSIESSEAVSSGVAHDQELPHNC